MGDQATSRHSGSLSLYETCPILKNRMTMKEKTYANLYKTIALFLADGFDTKSWRVGMSADHGNRIPRLHHIQNLVIRIY